MLAENPSAVLVDVRTEAEWTFVGVPDLSSLGREVVFVEWNRSGGRHNDAFLAELQRTVPVRDADRPVIFLCRSGQRSIGAAGAATAAGLTPSFNVLDGFEGPLDAEGHRGSAGWRAAGLPWRQE